MSAAEHQAFTFERLGDFEAGICVHMELAPLSAACDGSRSYTKPTIAIHRSIFHSTATRVQGNTAWQERSKASYRETSIAQWQGAVHNTLFKTTASSAIVDDLPVSENRLKLLSKKSGLPQSLRCHTLGGGYRM